MLETAFYFSMQQKKKSSANDADLDADLLEVLDLTEQDLCHAQHNDSLPDMADIHD